MLFKSNLKPAVAMAGTQSSDNSYRKADNNITLMSADGDDFGNFVSGSSQKEGRAPKKRQSAPEKRKPAKKRNIAPFVIAVLAIAALIVIIAIFASILRAPMEALCAQDTAYFTYVDAEGKYHILVNGEKVKTEFENPIELIPAADNSFAYVLEDVDSDESGDSGIRMYILQGKKLSVSEGLANSCIALAKLKPGIIYKYNKTIYRFTGDTDNPIIRDESASNFIISDDANTIVYTSQRTKDGNDINVLKYFKDSGSDDLCSGFKPLALSSDGRYIYGTSESNGRLYYIDANAKEIKPSAITKSEYGAFGEITEINAEGNEIIFYTDTTNGAFSFLCNVEKKSLTQLGKGIFRSVNADPSVVRVDTFMNAYFTAQNAMITTDDDGEIEVDEDGEISTYRLTKKGCTKIVDKAGKFSPDGKYFYYIDDNDQLKRISLSSSNYEKNAKVISGYVSDFEITQKGDVYMFSSTGDKDDEPVFLYYWDSSKKSQERISAFADPNSMNLCANTLYFSETKSTSEGESTVIYTSTDGSAKAPAEFKSINLTKAPTMQMGVGKNGYAYVIDDDSNAMVLFFTSNGKKFDLVAEDCSLPPKSFG